MSVTEDEAWEVYAILVEHAGASDDPLDRASFVNYMTGTNIVHEFRFMGTLGFGGKCYLDRDGFRVSCYPEDRTPERQAVIDGVNALLRQVSV